MTSVVQDSILADVRSSYNAQASNEITLAVGDVVRVMGKDSNGWWEGNIVRQILSDETPIHGFFPSSHVEERIQNNVERNTTLIDEDDGKTIDITQDNEEQLKTDENDDISNLSMKTEMMQPEIIGPAAELKNSRTRYGMWATNMTIGCAFGYVACGTVAFYWISITPNAVFYSPIHLVLAIYAILAGIGILVYESSWKVRAPSNFPARAIVYSILAIPGFFSIATLVPAAHLVIAAAFHLFSAFSSETFVQENNKPKKKQNYETNGSLWNRVVVGTQEQNKTSKVVFTLLYISANIAIFLLALFNWFEMIDAMPPGYSTSQFVAWAKAWGGVLDLNCALILLPVCRTFIRYLYDLSTQTQSKSQRVLRRILSFVPLDKALAMHKTVAWVILFAAIMHTIAHLVNYGFSPDVTWDFYGIWPWVTGVGIFICMMFMYGAVPANVKRYQFEIFWYSHHFFIGFFVLLIPHGRGGFNRAIWPWIIGPIFIYLLERLYRTRSAYQTVTLTSFTNMGVVFALSFDKKSAFPGGYKEGQYLYLNCPYISKGEWHPFTISSAPQEEDVSLHIRPQQDGSWTRQLVDYIALLVPPNTSFYSFKTATSKGRILGPDGRHILRVYGPHSAPTQHISEYSVDMICGAGIGVTPLCATLKSIVHHRWKFSIGCSYPDHAYFYFVTSYKDLDAFRWFVRMLKEADDEVHGLWAANPSNAQTKTFEFHLYVTSVPKDIEPFKLGEVDDTSFWGYQHQHDGMNLHTAKALWSEKEMFSLLKNPPKVSRLGNVRVYNGRPNWDERFIDVQEKHSGFDIGVAFCGNPIIGKDLKLQCAKFSNFNTNTFFRLHKEEF